MVRRLYHVEIGKDVSIRPHNESGAFALNRLEITRTAPRGIIVGLSLEKQIVEVKPFVAVVLFRDLDDDDARRDDFENFGESIVQGVNDILSGRRCGGGTVEEDSCARRGEALSA